LDETYERTLLDIDDENWEYAHRLFQCILVARRPLHINELAGFLAFKSEAEGCGLTHEGDWRPENPRDMVLSTCSSLVAVVNVDGSPVMQFSHFSVKEYLTSRRITEGPVSRYYTPLEPAHIFVTQACLSLLLWLNRHVTKKSIEEFSLARYAGRYWAGHADFGDVSSHTEGLMKQLFNPESHHFANWVWIYDTISDQSVDSEGPSRPELAPLHYASQHGFHRVVEWLITTCSQDVDESGNYGAPLHIACREGRFTVVDVLLKHDADVNACDQDNVSPLHFAGWYGHPKIARLLLEHGADVNSKTWLNETPLCLVSEGRGNMEVAEVLLEHGADPNARSMLGGDPLTMALHNGNHRYDPDGHQDLAKLLLEHGADPRTPGVHGQTPLHIASQRGYLEVTQRLLELGVDVNSRDDRGRTPLQEALRNGHERVVRLLLQQGANGLVALASGRHMKGGTCPSF
jgi:ankyrin repeat protein